MKNDVVARRRTALAALLVVTAASCATRGQVGGGPEQLDPKFTLSSYYEEGRLVALVVGTRATRMREKRSHIPLEVAIVNKGMEALTLTRESFTLIDEEGRRYPAVGSEELAEEYGSVDLDRRLGEIAPVVRNRFGSYQQIRSTLTRSFDKPIEQTLHLPRYSFSSITCTSPAPRTASAESASSSS